MATGLRIATAQGATYKHAMSLDNARPASSQLRNSVIALLLLAVVGWIAWHFTRTTERGGERRPTAAVGTAQATPMDVPVTLQAIGSVQPIVVATVRSQLAGNIFSLHFTEGQQVRQGQLLAIIDPRPYQLALSQARANLIRDQATLDQARVDLERYRILWAQDSIAHQQVDTQAATVKQLEGTVAADKAAVGTATLNLAYTSITAPVAGKAGLRQVDIGNYVTPSDTMGIVIITQLEPIDVTFSLPQVQLPEVQTQLRAGHKLPVTATDQTGQHVLAQGEFLTFDNQIDVTTGTVKAKARFANSEETLFPNQFVNVSVLVKTLSHALTVPVSSVRHGGQGDFVFVLQSDRTVKSRAVQTGVINGLHIVVAKGLRAGETVITEGADGLSDGASVTLAGAKTADPASRAPADNGH
ncbi:efflux RND transporter periplasmic adaptor subunit [Steroidobacter cummioxidans]|uniref:efflux RND transporter periplasmic adaptor subunit n=1 Tax=Steroidobacter cummioxidans TaxID=1803913 RepID=UPI001379F739|nr:efflux RND transporter periplasmic adaptor subunit [Steroidobacter cummioxidans]